VDQTTLDSDAVSASLHTPAGFATIFDPATSALLGEREVAARRMPELQVPAGTETGLVAYLESRVVDSLGEGAPPGAGHLRRSIGCYERPSLHASAAVLHGPDPIATCAELWREGVMGTTLRRQEREGKIPPRPDKTPNLIACEGNYPAVTYVFPGDGPFVAAASAYVPPRPNSRNRWGAAGFEPATSQ
jgi:hypothetical protein